jgi:hypothetical protein
VDLGNGTRVPVASEAQSLLWCIRDYLRGSLTSKAQDASSLEKLVQVQPPEPMSLKTPGISLKTKVGLILPSWCQWFNTSACPAEAESSILSGGATSLYQSQWRGPAKLIDVKVRFLYNFGSNGELDLGSSPNSDLVFMLRKDASFPTRESVMVRFHTDFWFKSRQHNIH